jgi:membrane protein DedA with SNARE-associated domain
VPLASVSGSITSLIGNHGVEAVFLLLVIDAVFPAASELVMLYAGALAAGAFAEKVVLFGHPIHSHPWALVVMVLAGTLGYLVGALIGWGIGLYGGRPLLERRGRWLHLPPERLARAERWFDRFGELAVFIGRITPIARSFISIPAGVFRARLALYTTLTVVGSLIWCAALGSAGYGLGTQWRRVDHGFRYVDYAVLAAAVLAGGLIILRWRRSARLAARRVEDPAH